MERNTFPPLKRILCITKVSSRKKEDQHEVGKANHRRKNGDHWELERGQQPSQHRKPILLL